MSRTARLDNAMGESNKDALRVASDSSLKLEFHGSKISPDTGTTETACPQVPQAPG